MSDRLESWKEIATHLRRQVRTVQRWEKTEGLPVHRHVHASRGTVFASRAELDAWLHARTAAADATLDAPSSQGAGEGKQAVTENGTGAGNGGPAPQAPPARRWTFAGRAAAASVAALVALVAWLALQGRDAHGFSGSPAAVRLVALPFASVGSEPVDDPQRTGLLDGVITRLAQLAPERLKVIGRTSSAHIGERGASVAEIGRELAVQYVLEGSVMRDGERVRASARLVRAEEQDLVWSETFELVGPYPWDQLAARISAEVGRELVGIGVEAAPDSTISPQAQDAWLRGRYLWHKGTRSGFLESRKHFEKAIEIAPDFVDAHVGLAHAHNLLGRYGHLPPDETFPLGRDAALRALELDPNCAEAHASLALVRFYYDWDFAKAAESFQRAIELAPGLALAHHWYAHFLSAMGLPNEAIDEVRLAQELEPMWALITSDAAWFYYRARRFEDAAQASRRALALEPRQSSAASCLTSSLKRLGREEQAWSELRAFLAAGDLLDDISDLDESTPKAAIACYWSWVRSKIEGLSGDRYVPAVARVYSLDAAEQPDELLHWLEVGLRTRDRVALLTKIHPHFDDVRDHPRFQKIVEAVGFPEDARKLL